MVLKKWGHCYEMKIHSLRFMPFGARHEMFLGVKLTRDGLVMVNLDCQVSVVRSA
jgi:hypothetical protein